MRTELALPLFNSVLERMVGEGTLGYEQVIRTKELLALQDHESAVINHDGATFVLTHQCQELKLKLVAHELSAVLDALDDGRLTVAMLTIDRVRIVFETLITELGILETLSPVSYQTVRETLGTGSGQESPGYNQVINAAPLLWSRLEALFDAAGTSLEEVYGKPDAHVTLFALCESFTTLDACFQKWLYHHFMVVRRVIGVESMVDSLATNPTTLLAVSMLKPLFEPLWDLRCDMTLDWTDRQAARASQADG